jgi:L-iditol 2-dehydrogenase
VAADWRVVCGECYQCRRGVFNFCSNRRADVVVGGYAEKGVATPANLRPIPDSVSYEEACFTEPLACCLNGSRNSRIQPGDDVVVIGAGPIGLMHAQLAKHHGARVIICDRIPSRLEKAQELGADVPINVDTEDAEARVLELTGGRGAAVVILAVGVTKAAEMALRMAALNATVNLFAGFYPSGTLDFDPNVIHYKQIHLTGSHDFTPHDFTMALKLVEDGIVRVKPLISHRLPLAELHAGLATVRKQEGLKVVIEIGG